RRSSRTGASCSCRRRPTRRPRSGSPTGEHDAPAASRSSLDSYRPGSTRTARSSRPPGRVGGGEDAAGPTAPPACDVFREIIPCCVERAENGVQLLRRRLDARVLGRRRGELALDAFEMLGPQTNGALGAVSVEYPILAKLRINAGDGQFNFPGVVIEDDRIPHLE